MLQDLWRQNLDWDTAIEGDMKTRWITLRNEIEMALQTVFPRFYFQEETLDETNLHIFVDASTKAYGAVAYICKGHSSAIVMAKTRVAPLKELTLPQLELMAAVIGARLSSHLQSTLECTNVTLWSDSQIVLHWLSSTKTLKRFIANRVKEIQDLTLNYNWKYCPTEDNPADLLTLGITYEQYKGNSLWKRGPHWITDIDSYPNTPMIDKSALALLTDCENIEHRKDDSTCENGIHSVIEIERYSSYKKLLRITSYVVRFIDNLKVEKKDRMTGNLKPSEIQRATELWLRNVQQSVFSKEYKILKSGTTVMSKAARIRQLRLFVDTNDLIRSNGRIHNAELPDTAKFPYILPNDHYLSKLIVLDAHENISHSGVNSTTAYIRQTFWIPAIRQLDRKTLRKCVMCRKVIGKPYSAPEQPPLPKLRLQQAPPFTTTGIDFTGALHVRGTDNKLTKAYICLFTCASTRAIHLEVVPNLSEETFLQAIRRFCSRKSTRKTVMTDNANTFEAASEEIKRLCESDKLQEAFTKQGIEWIFIPKRAPWFGGWWERLIGLTKTSLKKILGKSLVDLETLQTIVTEIECNLNDRPLTHISSDLEDLEPLTPSNLLYGRRMKTLPYPATIDKDLSSVTLDKSCVQKRVKRQCLLIEQFWNRWKTEYVTALRETHANKNGKNSIDIKIGDLVLIHDDNNRKVLWKTGVVDKLNYGHDGLVRSAIIRTKNGTTSRPVVKLYPLEINADVEHTDEEDDDQPHEENMTPNKRRTLLHRQAALRAKEKIKQWTV